MFLRNWSTCYLVNIYPGRFWREAFWQCVLVCLWGLVNILFDQYLPGPFLKQRHFGRMLYVSGELVKILFGQYLPGPFLERRHLGSVFHGYLGKIQFGQYSLGRFWWVLMQRLW